MAESEDLEESDSEAEVFEVDTSFAGTVIARSEDTPYRSLHVS
jgi:hypothetical protein